MGETDVQQQQQQQEVEAAGAAGGAAAAASGTSRSSSSSSISSFIGPPFSAAANATATLATMTPRLGGPIRGQRQALPKPRTEFKVNPKPSIEQQMKRQLHKKV